MFFFTSPIQLKSKYIIFKLKHINMKHILLILQLI